MERIGTGTQIYAHSISGVGVRKLLLMKSFLKKYWHWLTVTLLFVVLVVFSRGLPLVDYVKTKTFVRRLKAERAVYEEQIRRDSIFLENLKDDAFLEKYAREKFYMHADNEEVYLFE